jgi:hypothetical protein
MSEIPKVKGSQLSVGQRVAWPIYAKDDSGKVVNDNLNQNVINEYYADTVKEIDSNFVHFASGKKRKVTGNFIRLKHNTVQSVYDKNQEDLLRDLYIENKTVKQPDKEAKGAVEKTEVVIEKTPLPLDEKKYLDKYTKQIEDTLETVDELSKKLKNAEKKLQYDEEQVNSKIYSVAKILSAAREEATQQKDEKLEKKLFAKLKKQVSEKFKAISTRNLNKAIKVASDPRIQRYQSRLPVAHTVLYSLTSLSNAEFDTLMDDENVTPNKTREDLLKIVREIKGKEPQPKKYIITRISETEASEKDIEDLKKDLESKGWDIKDSATKTQKSKT